MKPAIILFAGPACSWKSTIAGLLSSRTGVPHLEMDAVRVRILPDASHSREDRVVALRAVLLAAEHVIRQGSAVILDAQYRRAEDRREVRELASELGCPMALIECAVSPDEAARWFRERAPDPVRPDLTEEVVRQGAEDYPFTREGLFLNTSALNPEECVALIENYLIEL